MGGEDIKTKITDLDIKGYVKHVLIKGSVDEKRELLGEIKNELVLKDKEIILKRN